MSTQRLRRAATFPKMRRHIAASLRVPGLGEFALLSLIFVATLPYVVLRSLADGWRAPVDGSPTERSLFGGLPTVALQDRFHGAGSSVLDNAAVYVHMSWFFIPAVVTLLVAWKWRSEFKSYAAWYLGVMYVAVAVFIAMPMSPPWLSDPHVTRIVAAHWGEVRVDNNPMAAFPSLHVALPLTLALWSLSRRHVALGAALAVYAALISTAVVYLGEHYVIDVIGACAVAGLVVAADVVWREFRLTQRRALAGRSTLRGRTLVGERGQNLVEFALMFPVVLVFLGVIIVVGLALHTRSNMQQAVREGARQAAIGATLGEVQNLAAGNAREQLKPEDVQWCFPAGPTGTHGRVGDPVTVFIYKGGAGYPYDLVSLGTLNASVYGGALTVRLDPRATTRLERSVPASTLSSAPACPS